MAGARKLWALVICLLLGCAGRAANPVLVYQHGDEGRSCDALERDLELIDAKIIDLIPETDKTARNVGMGVAGVFLLVPFFFMDLSKAEEIEVKALSQRYNHLLQIAEDKGCGLKRDPLPEFKS